MTAGILSGSVVAIIAAVSVLFLAVGMYMFGAMHGWEPPTLEERDGSGVDRLRCPACGGIKFHREAHTCPTRSVAQRITTPPPPVASPVWADYDRPPPPPPPKHLPPPRVRDPIEARARP